MGCDDVPNQIPMSKIVVVSAPSCGFRPENKRATHPGAALAMAGSSTNGESRGWWCDGQAMRPSTAHVLDILADAADDDDVDSYGDDSSSDEEGGEDWLGNHNLGEYRAAWHRGDTDTVRHVDSDEAAPEDEEEGGVRSATGPDASVGSAAAGDVVVQVRGLLSLPFSA